MVEWTKPLSVFWPVGLTFWRSRTRSRVAGHEGSAHKPWSGRTLTSRRKTFPDSFLPTRNHCRHDPGFDYRACGSNAPLRHATGQGAGGKQAIDDLFQFGAEFNF